MASAPQSRHVLPITALMVALFAASAVGGAGAARYLTDRHTTVVAPNPRDQVVDKTVAAPVVDADTNGACAETVHLSWIADDDAVSYSVMRNYRLIATVEAGTDDVLTYTGEADPGARTTTFQVAATLLSGDRTAFSREIDAITCPHSPVVTGRVAGSRATVTWTPTYGADRYVLYRDGKQVYAGTKHVYTETRPTGSTATYTVKAVSDPAADTSKIVGVGGAASPASTPVRLTFGG